MIDREEQPSSYEILPDVVEDAARKLLANGWDAWSVAKEVLDIVLGAMQSAGAPVVMLDQYVRLEHEHLVKQDLKEREGGDDETPYLRAYERYQSSDSPQNWNALVDLLHENLLDNMNDGLLRDVCGDVISEVTH